MKSKRSLQTLMAGAALALILAGCSQQAPTQSKPAPAPQGGATAAAKPAASEQSQFPGTKLLASLPKATVGSKVTLQGSGFPAGATVDLTWKTFDGSYALEQEEVVFGGVRYEERVVSLPRAQVGADGAFATELVVPEDFGGMHDILAHVDGKFATKMGFTVSPEFSVSQTTGPVGTPIEIRATGLGFRTQESQWHVAWDNGFTGYMMAAATHGTATARIRASGAPGPHVLKIWRNYRGIPYLNPHQGPFGALPDSTFMFNVSEGSAGTPTIWAHPKPEDVVRPAPQANAQGGASLGLSADRGTVGSPLAINGAGFAPGQAVKLTWATRTGQKITNTGLMEGFDEEIRDLPAATAGPDGAFRAEVKVFDDYAGLHRVTASADGKLAEAYYSIYPSIVEFTDRARVGEEIKIHLKGVGWTIQGKTYAVVYDNNYLGYICSFSTKGDIDLKLPASGAPGLHTIDLYPAVYEGREPTPDIYSKPNLTYIDNHPGGPLPAFRLTLAIVP